MDGFMDDAEVRSLTITCPTHGEVHRWYVPCEDEPPVCGVCASEPAPRREVNE